MSRLIPVYVILSLILVSLSCKRPAAPGELVPAHHVSYKVSYMDRMAGDIPTNILPKTLEAYYSRHHVCTIINGFMNQFRLVQIADLRHRRVSTLLTFFGTEVFYTGEPGELPAGIADPGSLDLIFTGDTVSIGGLLSERIRVSSPSKEFDIYCTDEFSSRRPNLCTPYHEVDQPLTRFIIRLSYLDMELTCKDYRFEEVDAGIFGIPPTFLRASSRKEMEDIINNLFTKE